MRYNGHTQVKLVYFRETCRILEYEYSLKFGRIGPIDGLKNSSAWLYPG